MILPEEKQDQVKVNTVSPMEEMTGNLKFQDVDDKLLHSVLENDQTTIDEAKLIQDSINNGVSSFTPDILFEQFVKDFKQAKKIVGESIIRILSGYDSQYVEKNIKIPEFQRELKKKMTEKVHEMRDKGLLNKENQFTDKGVSLASLVSYVQEIEKLLPTGIFGEKYHKKRNVHGEAIAIDNYRKGARFRNIAVKSTIKVAARRNHDELLLEDLRLHQRQQKGNTYIIYALDASGSMKGKKIGTAKKAGIALAYKATEEKDNVGLLVFGKEVTCKILPTQNFIELLRAITTVKATAETNFSTMIAEAILMFPSTPVTKHLLILSDALPTHGDNPIKETLHACEQAAANGITISVVGIDLDKEGKELAEKMTTITEGRLYLVRDIEELDQIVLMDYYSL